MFIYKCHYGGALPSSTFPSPTFQGIFISFCFDYTLTFMCILLLQHVEDPGINIPDQTVIKKGKPFPSAFQACPYRQSAI